MGTGKIETEAKFSVPDRAVFEVLQKLDRLGNFELKPGETEVIVDRYLDTADKRLYQAGFVCRIRQAANNQTLTLKALTPADGNIHRRQQIEVRVAPQPALPVQPQDWPASQVKDWVLEQVGQVSLQLLFTLYQTRHTREAVWQGQPVIEFSLDEVSLGSPEVVDYFELEAELIGEGTESDLTRFIKALQAQAVLPAQSQSKFERAWAQVMDAEG